MSPELINLAISLGVFALLAIIWRSWFATSVFPGQATAPVARVAEPEPAPRNLVAIHGEAKFDELINSGPTCFVDWTATWCGPCSFIAPAFARLARQNPAARFLKVDVDENGALAKRFKIKSMPTFLCFKKGVQVDQLVGADEARLTALVQRWAN